MIDSPGRNEKKITSPTVFHAKEVHTWQTKIVTVDEEVGRRLENMDSLHTVKEKAELLANFAQKIVCMIVGQETKYYGQG